MQNLGLHQSQSLQQKLSPQQIQIIKMLELPTLELEERINQELIENPALEEGCDLESESLDNEIDSEEDIDRIESPLDDLNWDDYSDDEETPDYKLYTNN